MHRFLLLSAIVLLVGCATRQGSESYYPNRAKHQKVRTTAYTHTEAGGHRNAIGGRLSSGPVKSAASDWSRFPLGTKFKLLRTGDLYKIDDYGSALVGTNTIDLYKTSRKGVRQWGTRQEEIQILEWGCPERSLKVLETRSRSGYVRRMVNSLRKQKT